LSSKSPLSSAFELYISAHEPYIFAKEPYIFNHKRTLYLCNSPIPLQTPVIFANEHCIPARHLHIDETFDETLMRHLHFDETLMRHVHISANEPFIFAEQPYISSREPYIP